MRLRLACFNLESFGAGAATLDARIAALRPQLVDLRADILCLQEVNAQEPDGEGPRRMRALERLLEATPYAQYERVVSTGPGGRGPADVHNLVTLSRWPIRAQRQYRNDLVAPPGYRLATADPPASAPAPVAWDRPLLHTGHAIGADRVLHVINLHLRAPLASFVPGQKLGPFAWKTTSGWAEGFFVAAIKRTGQALEARLVVDRIFDAEPEALIAVCGDFNAELRETPLRAVRADAADTGNPGLAGRALFPVEAHVPASRRYSVLHGGRPVLLDHLLVSEQLRRAFRSAAIDNRGLRDELYAWEAGETIAGSFHAPVVAEFELQSDA